MGGDKDSLWDIESWAAHLLLSFLSVFVRERVRGRGGEREREVEVETDRVTDREREREIEIYLLYFKASTHTITETDKCKICKVSHQAGDSRKSFCYSSSPKAISLQNSSCLGEVRFFL